MISLRIKLIFFFLLVFILALTICLVTVVKKESEITQLEQKRFEFYVLVSELKKNFNLFSQIVNRYVISEKSEYSDALELFVQVDTRNDLKKFRDKALLDLNFQLRELLSIQEEMRINHFLESIGIEMNKFEKILYSKSFSQKLLLLDVEAINAMNGYFKDDNGQFSIQGKPDFQKAKNIIYSNKYIITKQEISTTLTYMFDYIEGKMREYIITQKQIERKMFALTFFIAFLIILLLAYSIYYFHQNLINPLAVLLKWTKSIEEGEYNIPKKSFREDEMGLLMNSFNQMSKTIYDNIRHLEAISTTDALTQLDNRRSLEKVLQEEYYNFQRYMTPCSLIMIDIDFFKQVNDTHGHNVGDQILKEMAHIMANNIRSSDTLGRWGGEEFLVICPKTSYEEVKVVAQSLRNIVEKNKFPVIGSQTASFGTYSFKDGLSIEEVIKKADDALYQAKANGRNQVV